MQKLVDLDYTANMAFVVEAPGEQGHIIAMCRHDVDPATNLADIAFVVRDEWQNKGIGTLLLRRAIEAARARGLSGFSADVLAHNFAMLGVFHRSGLFVRSDRSGSVYHVTMTFDSDDPSMTRNA
jgi:GNAT superfamily N-acetyltransferase